MSRKNKEITGLIESVTAPKRDEKRNSWYINTKASGRWKQSYFNVRSDADDTYEILMKRKKAAESNFDVVPTWMTQDQARQAEYAYQALENAGFLRCDTEDASEEFAKAVTWLVKNYKPIDKKPTVRVFWEYFMEKQENARLSPVTIRDYNKCVGAFVETHGNTRIDSLKREDIRDFINGYSNSCTRYAVHGYLNAYFNFCCGRNNSYMPEQDWLDRNPINWKKERYEVGEIASYTYDEVVTLIKAAKKHGSLGYTLMRLYSMMRNSELERFVQYGGEFLHENPFINWETGVIHLDNRVYRKRGRAESRGRFVKIHPTFMKWLKYLRDEKISIKRDAKADQATRKSVPEKYGKTNIWRHTSITMYIKDTGNISEVSYACGSSDNVLRQSYLNMNILTEDAEKFFRLTPERF